MSVTEPAISDVLTEEEFRALFRAREEFWKGAKQEDGFCKACGIVRVDLVHVTGRRMTLVDCPCTAKTRHKDTCTYVKACSMWISIGGCDAHGRDACEPCDCDCGAIQ